LQARTAGTTSLQAYFDSDKCCHPTPSSFSARHVSPTSKPILKGTSVLDFIRSIATQRGLVLRRPGLPLAFLIAEFFYKFHSFALECLAFLLTWLLVDAVVDALAGLRSRREGAAQRHGSKQASHG
jgi:hypothetical protein